MKDTTIKNDLRIGESLIYRVLIILGILQPKYKTYNQTHVLVLDHNSWKAHCVCEVFSRVH